MTVKTAVRRLQLDLGQLIERHDTAKSLTDYSVYANDPIGFIRDVLHADPWDRQLDIAEAVRDHPLIVVRSCNAAGKDWIAAHLALWWVYARKGLVLMTGPTERQVKEIAMGEVARAFSRARDLPGELYATALRLGRDETAGILAFTSTEASKLTGHHADRILAILTEAQGVPDWAWEALMACAVGDEDRLLAVGNPLEPSGTFFTVSRSPDWCAIRISAEEHPNLVQGRTVIPGGVTQAMARRFANAYGRNSSIYTSRVLGEFPDQGDEALFRRSWLDAAVARWHELGSEVDGSLVVAVDPARYGPDATGIAVARGSVVQELEAWAGASDLMATTKRVCALLERLGVRRAGGVHCKVVVDVVGLGVGVCDRLRELGYWTVEFNGGEQARQPDRFLNRRAESHWYLREQLEAGLVALPDDKDLMDELLSIRWSPTTQGKIRIEAKDQLKGRLGRSPDRADAVTMALGFGAYAPPVISADGFRAANARFRRPSLWTW